MTRRERLMATLNGMPVDRPPVSFYELNGFEDTENKANPFNIFSHPSWKPLIEFTRDRTDRIVMSFPSFKDVPTNPAAGLTETTTEYDENGSRHTMTKVNAGGRILTSHSRRDPDVDTVWQLEHLLKDVEDAKAWLSLPEPQPGGVPDISGILDLEEKLGDSGIVMLDTGDPIGYAAPLFHMELFTIIALTEQELFHRLLQRFARTLLPRIEAVAAALPGRLWRIWGPEYASPPYLPPSLFHDYVVEYDRPMVEAIQKNGGFARIHSHGRLKDILDHIASLGASGLDPIEPPPQGDVELSYVRKKYGAQFVLFGNIEITDIENLPPREFEKKVRAAIEQGTTGEGRGFVLMPSACPIGRELSDLTLANYRKMVEIAEKA